MELITFYTKMEDLIKYRENGITTIVVGEPFFATRLPVSCDFETIVEIKKECDSLGLKLGILMNRIFFDEDISAGIEALKRYKTLEPDFIEYTDPSVYVQANKLNMTSYLAYNPDTLMCNDRDVQFYLDLKIKKVILSKEITLTEMIQIIENTNGVTEVIIFGRLNMSYSKRPLITNYLQEIKKNIDVKNRQDMILIETTRDGKMPIVEDDHGTVIYTDYTLAGFREIRSLIEAGCTSFKFDNRFCPTEAFIDCLDGYQRVLNGEDSLEIENKLKAKYPELALSSGYMYQKTNLVK